MIQLWHAYRPLLALLAVAGTATGCKAPQPFGDRHSLIVRADPTLLPAVDSTLMEALERRVFTTRPERTFKVTFVATGDTLWNDLRQWHQVLVLGSIDDPDVARLAKSAKADPEAAPAIFQVEDVWARGQLVTVLLLPHEGQVPALELLLSDLHALLDAQYDEWVRLRMYASGVNDSLSELLSTFGFTLQLPAVYVYAREDSVFRFRNVYPDPGTLLRSVTVISRRGVEPPGAESLLAWRESMAETYYDPPQYILESGIRFDSVWVGGAWARELRGVWLDRSDFPAAGPFIVRAVTCPAQDRTYYIDAWVYAPSQDKYPYVRQLQILLGSFRCSDGALATTGAPETRIDGRPHSAAR